METNKGGRISATDIIDYVVAVEGVFEKVFGKLLNKLVYDRAIQSDIKIIKNVYKMIDIDEIFDVPIDRSEFKELTKMIFRFQENAKPSFFGGQSQG